MELTNKRIQYNVANSNETLSLTGNITIGEESIIDSFNGNISKDSTHLGNFYFSESSDGTVNFNCNNVAADALVEIEQFILTTVNEVKNDNK